MPSMASDALFTDATVMMCHELRVYFRRVLSFLIASVHAANIIGVNKVLLVNVDKRENAHFCVTSRQATR